MQQNLLPIVGTVVLAVITLALLAWLGRRDRTLDTTEAPPEEEREAAAPTSEPGPAAAQPGLERVHDALRAGRKIEAIKHYRELTGVGLKEAKDAVDAMEAGGPAPAFTPRPAPTSATGPGGLDEVTRLARTGQLIQAIKLHRELTGLDLRSSKEAVERLRDGG